MFQIHIKNLNQQQATKFDNQKPRFSLVPQLALDEVIKGFEHGASKYGVYNYSLGMDYTRYFDAAQRHMRAWLQGEDIDESGIHHLALAACNNLMLLENILTNMGTDNRNTIYKKLQNATITAEEKECSSNRADT